MACRLLEAKPLPKPMLINLVSVGQTPVKFESNFSFNENNGRFVRAPVS